MLDDGIQNLCVASALAMADEKICARTNATFQGTKP